MITNNNSKLNGMKLFIHKNNISSEDKGTLNIGMMIKWCLGNVNYQLRKVI